RGEAAADLDQRLAVSDRRRSGSGRAVSGRAGGKQPRPVRPRAGPQLEENKKMKVRPLHDRVLVRRLDEGEQKVGGIIIPDTAKEKPQQAEVMAVGSGRILEDGTRVPLDVKAGDRVLVGKWSGTDVKID